MWRVPSVSFESDPLFSGGGHGSADKTAADGSLSAAAEGLNRPSYENEYSAAHLSPAEKPAPMAPHRSALSGASWRTTGGGRAFLRRSEKAAYTAL